MSNKGPIKSQPLEDRALKDAARLFGEELLPLLGIKEKVKCLAPTEQVYLNPKDFIQGFNYVMQDGSWLHLEFESDSIQTADLRRFRTYEAILSQYYKVPVITCVLCSSTVKKLTSRLSEGINTYKVNVIRLKDHNADQILQTLEYKQKTTHLTRSDLLNLLLTPLMDGTMSQQERIARGITLLRQEQEHLTKEEHIQMEAILYTFAQKFLTTQELKKIKEMINMTVLGEMIFQDGLEKGLEKGEERINQLCKILLDANRLDDLRRATTDKTFQKQLIAELLPDERI